MYCMVCGNKIDQPPDKVTFCPYCGADISKKRQAIMGNGVETPPTGSVNAETRFGTPSMDSTTMGNGSQNQSSYSSTNFQTSNPNYNPRADFPPNNQPMWGNQYGSAPRSMGTPFGNLMQSSPFASFGERLVAWIIDMIVLYLIGSLFTSFFLEDMGNSLLAMIQTLDPETMTDAQYEALMSEFTSFLMISELVNWILSVVYFFLFTWFAKGRTLGKMALKLVVVDQDTLEPVTSPGRILVDCLTKRPLLMFFDIIIGAIAGRTPLNQYRITQKISKTVVAKKNLLAAPMMNQPPTF